MDRLVFSREETEAEHEYARPHIVFGQLLHGGFDELGTYLSPRTLNRWRA